MPILFTRLIRLPTSIFDIGAALDEDHGWYTSLVVALLILTACFLGAVVGAAIALAASRKP